MKPSGWSEDDLKSVETLVITKAHDLCAQAIIDPKTMHLAGWAAIEMPWSVDCPYVVDGLQLGRLCGSPFLLSFLSPCGVLQHMLGFIW